MPPFHFQLEPLLRYRRNRRGLCRQMLAKLVADERVLTAQQQGLERSQAELLDELRRLGKEGEVDVDRAVVRRDFAGQLVAQARLLQQRKTLVAEQAEMCRRALVRADHDVKALEKLAERRRAEFQYRSERRAQHTLEDAWSALNGQGSGLQNSVLPAGDRPEVVVF